MVRKYLIAGAIIAAFTMPALAAAKTYYVVEIVKTKKCEIVTKKPDGVKLIMVGTDTYKKLADATKAEKAAVECGAKPKA
jgi:hypothetical protein